MDSGKRGGDSPGQRAGRGRRVRALLWGSRSGACGSGVRGGGERKIVCRTQNLVPSRIDRSDHARGPGDKGLVLPKIQALYILVTRYEPVQQPGVEQM